MKNRNVAMLVGLGVLCGGWCVRGEAAETYSVDAVHSSVIFRIKHLDFSYFYGRFNEVSGTFSIDTKNPAKSSFDIKIQAESVDTHSGGRDKHLRSPDFLSAKEFPVIHFKSTKVKKKSKSKYNVTGDLTLHGVTKSVKVVIEHVGSGEHPRFGSRSGFEATFDIKRSDFGMNGMLGAVGDELRLIVAIEGQAG